MQIILDTDETWSIMSLIVSQVIDQTEISEEAKAALRRWRSEHSDGTAEIADLTLSLNEALGTVLDEQTTKMIRRKGRYVSSRRPR